MRLEHRPFPVYQWALLIHVSSMYCYFNLSIAYGRLSDDLEWKGRVSLGDHCSYAKLRFIRFTLQFWLSIMFDFLSKTFSSVFASITGKAHLTEKNMADALASVHDALLQADVPYAVAQEFIEQIKAEAVGQKVLSSLKPGEHLIKIVHEKLKAFLSDESDSAPFIFKGPATVMVLGLQGSGKTTSIAKMAYWASQGQKESKTKKILFGSVDFYRPAALDQLQILATQVGADWYRSPESDPVKAALDIQKHARAEGYDLLFLDTAGRLHVDSPMMEELAQINRAVAPTYKILVLDGMTGQESLAVAQAFGHGVGYHGAMITKMDSQTRGGAVFAFRYVEKKPILFIGTGEKFGDISLFHPDRMAGQILDMGDVLSLVEKAEAAIAKSDQERMYAAFMKGQLTLQDFADQLAMFSKLGSMTQLMRFLPGMGQLKLTPEQIEQAEKEVKKFKAIISSMTLKERYSPRILDASRKRRIALGAGVQVADVNILIKRFEESQQYAKLFKQLGRGNGLFK